jgi:hypothetical protein
LGRSIPDFVTAMGSTARELPLSAATVPEPATLGTALLAAGLLSLRRRRR